jgi:FKBP-type peptidyl-prolyl cis-trans isomerase
MASVGQRAAAITLAVLFLITSLGFSGAVIWQLHQENRQSKQATSSVDESKVNNSNANNAKTENKLQGTKLADFTPVTKVTTLEKIDTITGTGDEVKPGDTITAHYTGAVAATGIIFQSSHDSEGQPVSFSLNGVIKGWTDGVPGMKVGGKRRLLIPADQAYGANPPSGSGIPANADLVFDIELVKIGK